MNTSENEHHMLTDKNIVFIYSLIHSSAYYSVIHIFISRMSTHTATYTLSCDTNVIIFIHYN